MGAAVTSFAIVLLIAPYCIEKLQRLKFGQQVRDDGPAAHLIKTGTPTMGGVFLWGAVVASALLWGAWNGFVLISCLTVVLFAGIGFIDDYAKIKQKDTKGLSPSAKLVIQSLCALSVLYLTYLMPQYHQKSTSLVLEVVTPNNTVTAQTNVTLDHNWEWEVEYEKPYDVDKFLMVHRQHNPETGKTNSERLFEIPHPVDADNDRHKITSEIIKKDKYEIISLITMTSYDEGVQRVIKTTTTNIYQSRLFSAFLVPTYTEVVWHWPLAFAFLFFIFIIVGVSNATNLSDGLDGLAVGMGTAFYLPFGIFAYLMGNVMLSAYLFYPYIAGIGELAVFTAAAVGAFVGFLWYNVHPAEIFMGDTGSLPMGAVIAVIAIMLKQELLLVVAGFMFVLETMSVIIQVYSFKRFNRRVFKMAPIHHHFELSGWKENQVVVRFWIMSALCAMAALATIKIR